MSSDGNASIFSAQRYFDFTLNIVLITETEREAITKLINAMLGLEKIKRISTHFVPPVRDTPVASPS